jgi:hypothetical protein
MDKGKDVLPETGMTYKRWQLLAALFGSVVFFHTGTSYLEELLFKSYQFEYASFLVLLMFSTYVVLYILAVSILGQTRTGLRLVLTFDQAHHHDVASVCTLYAISNTISRIALNYVSIPFGMVFKSCKLVAVMIASGVVLGKRYSPQEYLIAMGFVAGMVQLMQWMSDLGSYDDSCRMHTINFFSLFSSFGKRHGGRNILAADELY